MIVIIMAPLLSRPGKEGQILEPREYVFRERGTEHTERWPTPKNGPWEIRHLKIAAADPEHIEPARLADVPAAWEQMQLSGVLLGTHNHLGLPLPLRLAATWFTYEDIPPKVSLKKTGPDFGLTLRWATDDLAIEGTHGKGRP